MSDFYKTIYSQVSQKKLSKDVALEIIRQYQAEGQRHPLLKQNATQTDAPVLLPPNQVDVLSQDWILAEVSEDSVEALEFHNHLIILCDPAEGALTKIKQSHTDADCYVLNHTSSGDLARGYSDAAKSLISLLQKHAMKYNSGVLRVQLVLSESAATQCCYGLMAILKCAQQENPKLSVQIIQFEESVSASDLVKPIKAEAGSADREVCYRKGQRYVRQFAYISVAQLNRPHHWLDDGVYLISGGVGGLGLNFAQRILSCAASAVVILIGRSDKDSAIEEKLSIFKGQAVEYHAVDVSDKSAVKALINHIVGKHGKLSGIIHSAGSLNDGFLINKTDTEIDSVFAPKVAGVLVLDEATKSLDLEFFVSCSSTAAVFGNVAQADYAAANAFLDEYMQLRCKLVAQGLRKGKSLSINWPLWQHGGMDVDASTRESLSNSLGMQALETEAGMQTLEFCLSFQLLPQLFPQFSQALVLSGDSQKIIDYYAAKPPAYKTVLDEDQCAIDTDLLKDKTVIALKRVFSEVTKLPVNKIDVLESLERYGIDSLMITQLNQILGEVFADVSKTLFYEYQCLDALAGYLVQSYASTCTLWVGLSQQQENSRPERVSNSVKILGKKPRTDIYRQTSSVEETSIAIIGLHGVYPNAPDLETFWENLKSGMDCISEIPQDRWNLEEFYEADIETAIAEGKSYSKWGGFIDGFADFDPLFFNLSPREAESMDPHERLFLQSCWSSLEDAGYTRASLQSQYGGNVGVFAGVTKTGFELYGPQLSELGEDIYLRSSFSSVANRVSYFLDLNGPSMPVDTMCSASFSAIHEACSYLARGECELAFAGGVNLYLHPSNYVQLCAHRMLSSDGQCKSFGLNGNGFVPGEGVGSIVLKPLSKAEADGDHIYAIIRSTSVNHGGKTNGYTVPNPNSQRDLITQALKKSAIHPRAISYIEAHGTGTELGDPIEISGLSQAFKTQTDDRQYCAIGSLKSNIGHMEAAAGLGGLTKVLLQMQHGQLLPSLHSAATNPNIDFAQTAFVVQQETAEWQRPRLRLDGEEEKEYPRIAGISSFGAGGSNAHIIVEEYRPKTPEQNDQAQNPSPSLFVLSASDSERLNEYANNILTYLENHRPDIANLSYTLYVGREAMHTRLAIVVDSLDDLIDKLKQRLKNQTKDEGVFLGTVNHSDPQLNLINGDEDFAKTVAAWVEKRKLAKLAEYWVVGGKFSFAQLYSSRAQRISLPTYPFAKERFWIRETIDKLKSTSSRSQLSQAAVSESVLHPLLHKNTSTFSEQRYSSWFSGKEFFLADHRVNGVAILPGAAYLELARAAIAQSLNLNQQHDFGIFLDDIVFTQAIAVGDDPLEVHIALSLLNEREVVYEVYTHSAEKDREECVHAQGKARILPRAEIENIRPRNILQTESIFREVLRDVDAEECYALFDNLGLHYGEAHRGIKKIQLGRNHAGDLNVIGVLSLPSSRIADFEEFGLHPSLIDAALQASIGMEIASSSLATEAYVPFAMESVRYYCAMSQQLKVLISPSAKKNQYSKSSSLKKIDLQLINDDGKVCVEILGYSYRLMAANKDQQVASQTLLLQSDWLEKPRVNTTSDQPGAQIVFLAGLDNWDETVLAKKNPGARIVPLIDESLEESDSGSDTYGGYAAQLQAYIQLILAEKPQELTHLQLVLSQSMPSAQGLIAMLKTAAQEYPNFAVQMIVLPADFSAKKLATTIQQDLMSHDIEIRYRANVREVRSYREINPVKPEVSSAWNNVGIYLITGGLGGLGKIVAKEILENTQNALVILSGRSEFTQDIKHSIVQFFGESSARVEYISSDISEPLSVELLIEQLIQRFGDITGVIHTAGIVEDNYLLTKTESQLRRVFSPKVDGVENLDRATKNIDLEVFINFSSIAAEFGNIAQADYAAANAYLDHFSTTRNALVEAGQRSGLTLSINWPLWEEGGMQVDKPTLTRMWDSLGLAPLPSQSGIAALRCALRDKSQGLIVLYGDAEKIRRNLIDQSEDKTTAVSVATTVEATLSESLASSFGDSFENSTVEKNVADKGLEQKSVRYFSQVLAAHLKLSVDRIDPKALLEKYGIDSIMITSLTNKLEKTFGSLSKTLFFEYQSIVELSDYFLDQHKPRLLELLGSEGEIEGESEADKSSASLLTNSSASLLSKSSASPLAKSSRFAGIHPSHKKMARQKSSPQQQDDIAIIGLHGRYPKSENIAAYWDVLLKGMDCVTEIPKERWDHSQYFDPQKGKKGKTYTKWGGFIDGVDEFDPTFFGISPREAEIMDPQERLFLQCVYHVIEDAGYTRESLANNTNNTNNTNSANSAGDIGVFVGSMYEEYQLYAAQSQLNMSASEDAFVVSGNPASIANRVSHFCNFHGPSLTVDTMCSSALTAIHLACESIQSGSCQLAFAGGVNVSIHPNKYLALGQGQFAASDGRCASFGEGGDGYVPGEGVGAVLLKPLQAAITDGDQIYAVIKGTALNHGGKTNGYTVPNPKAQAKVIARALDRANINPRKISYIEAHGTGTALGDPIEIAGLSKAFSAYTQDKQFCAIGSAKANIGHCESAAGIAGLTKVLLQMKYKTLVPSIHSENLNPNIDFSQSPFVVQRERAEWKRPMISLDGEKASEVLRTAGISSFGAGGSNAHIIVEEYQSATEANTEANTDVNTDTRTINECLLVVIPLSAKSAAQLKQQAKNLSSFINEAKDLADTASQSSLVDTGYSLQVGREAMNHRLAFLVSSWDELKNQLSSYLSGSASAENIYQGERYKEAHKETENKKGTLSLLGADQDLVAVVSQWIAAGKFSRLIELWVKGLEFDWELLYSGRKPNRISLPTYPFAKERYWVPSTPVASSVSKSGMDLQQESKNTTASEAAQVMQFTESWEEIAHSNSTQGLKGLKGLKEKGSPQKSLDNIVCFVSEEKNKSLLENQLKRAYPNVQLSFVSGLTQKDKQKTDNYMIDPTAPEVYKDTLRTIQKRHGAIDGILYFWPSEQQQYRRDISPILYLIQALGDKEGSKILCDRLLLAGIAKSQLDLSYLESWIGLERSLGLVLPNTHVCVAIDDQIQPSASEEAAWPIFLAEELSNNLKKSVLLRDDKRFNLTISEEQISDKIAVAPTELRNGGSYLITGGLGGLGYTFAKFLADEYSANLILSGRSSLDAGKQQRLDTLSGLGAKVIYLQADVTDKDAMRAGLDKALDQFGVIDGVLHIAGIDEEKSVLEVDASRFNQVIDAKITGTLLLEELLADQALDFFCLFSSASAILGDLGVCSYAMGNRFLSAYAQQREIRRERGEVQGKSLAIAWPLWADGGMQEGKSEQIKFYLKSSGQSALSGDLGVKIFSQMLAQDFAAPLVVNGIPSRVHRFLGISSAVGADSSIEVATDNSSVSKVKIIPLREELLGLSLEECVLADIKSLASELLKLPVERIGGEENLADFGFDSISLAELSQGINTHYDIDTTPAIFFSYPNINQLSGHLLAEYADVLASQYAVSEERDSLPTTVISGDIHNEKEQENHDSSPGSVSLTPNAALEPIAIIGMSGRFPGARNVEELWEILQQGRDVVDEIPAERFDWREFYGDPLKNPGKTDCKWLGALPGVKEFDSLFFEISPAEAETMDPRQRLLMQEAWRALEDAAYGKTQIERECIGMYVGVEQGDYQNLVGEGNAITSNHDGVLAARLAYALNLNGPTFALNTACSSGLVAAHQACVGLRAGECDSAIVAGVNLILTPRAHIGMSQSGMLSNGGKTFAFDQRANGMIPAEAVVALVLKPLSKAVADGDPIHALIPGSGINYDGKTNGITAPNGVAQSDLIKSVHKKFAIDASQIDCIATQATGTKLGDSVEVNALQSVFKSDIHSGEHKSEENSSEKNGSEKNSYEAKRCALISTKTNLGHTFAASGLVSLVCMVQAIRHQKIPATLNCEQDSDFIHWDSTGLYLNRECKPWPRREHGRMAAVSAFGMSGTNAHMLVCESQDSALVDGDSLGESLHDCIFVLSAKNTEVLSQQCKNLAEFISSRDWTPGQLRQLSFTLLQGRQHFNHRCAFVASNANSDELLKLLRQASIDDASDHLFLGEKPYAFKARKSLQRFADEILSAYKNSQNRDDLASLADLYSQGYDLDWSLLFSDSSTPQRIHLPTYPFLKKHHWVKNPVPFSQSLSLNRVMDSVDPVLYNSKTRPLSNGDDQVSAEDPVRGKDQSSIADVLLCLVQEQLGLSERDLNLSHPLARIGFNSIQAISLKYQAEQLLQCEIPLSVFGRGEFSLNYIAENIESQCGIKGSRIKGSGGFKPGVSQQLPRIDVNLAERYDDFPLSDIQESFYTGRLLNPDTDLGAHIYLELAVRSPLDIYRLNLAWQKLQQRHEMLRAGITTQGTQKIGPDARPYSAKVIDLRELKHADYQERVKTIRQRMECKVYTAQAPRLYDIFVSLHPDQLSVIHISIDELIVDGMSLDLLIKEWSELYENPDKNLEDLLAPLQLSFRDYILALEKFKHSERYQRDLQYWLNTYPDIKPGPSLSFASTMASTNSSPHFRLKGELTMAQWGALIAQAESFAVTPTVLLLGLFAEVMRSWTGDEGFTLLMTFANRLPIHAQVNQMVGPCISTNLFHLSPRQATFSENLSYYQRQLLNDLDHMSVSAVRVLRELKAQKKLMGGFSLPVVFTSMLNNADELSDQPLFADVIYSLNQTPQVGLDHQIRELNGGLNFTWDIDATIYDKQKISDLFEHYLATLIGLSSGELDWDYASLACENKVESSAEPSSQQPFPLTDQQQAYVFGRGKFMPGGGNSCQFYQSIDCPNLDLEKLHVALAQVIRIHPMLRTVINQDGTQKVLDTDVDYRIVEESLVALTESQRERSLHARKIEMMNRMAPLGEWPYFELRVSHISATKSCLHFCIDLLIADGGSIGLFLSQLLSLYVNGNTKSITKSISSQITKPNYTFSDYVNSALASHNDTRQQQAYWEKKFSDLPNGPRLPSLVDLNQLDISHHRRVENNISDWRRLKQQAQNHQVHPAEVLLAAYMEVIAVVMDCYANQDSEFSIVVPSWDRLDLHADINQVIGDFTALAWVSHRADKKTFGQRVKQVNQEIAMDLEQRPVSGLSVLRRVALKDRLRRREYPVVFTNSSPELSLPNAEFQLRTAVSKTPQVTLDNLSVENGNNLHCAWDSPEGLFSASLIDAMFKAYISLLELLRDDEGSWNTATYAPLEALRDNLQTRVSAEWQPQELNEDVL